MTTLHSTSAVPRVLKALRDYQIEDLAFYIRNPRTANLSDPATGKTPSALVYCEYLWRQFGAITIFTMPLNIFKQNRKKFFDFTNFKEEEVVILEGSPARRRKLASTPGVKCFIGSFNFFKKGNKGEPSNFELVSEYHKPAMWASMVDEFHLGYKSITSQRTLAWLSFTQRRDIAGVLCLTGTAIDGRLDTAFPIIHMIEPRYYAGYQDFLNQHAILDDYGRPSEWVNTEKVKKILAQRTTRRTFEQVYGKENKLIIHETVPMEADMWGYYKLVDEKARAQLAQIMALPSEQVSNDDFEDDLDAFEFRFMLSKIDDNPAVALLRARQIMQCPEDLGLNFKTIGKDERIKILVSAAAQAGKKSCVFAVFPSEVERITLALRKEGLRVGMIHGGVPNNIRNKVDDMFKAGELDVVVATQDTTGVGLDWEFLDTMIFASMDYKDSAFIQAYRRGIRGHRDTPLLIYVLEYEKTIDPYIFAMVEKKMALAQEVQPDKEIVQIKKTRSYMPKGPAGSRKPFVGAPGQKIGFGALKNS